MYSLFYNASLLLTLFFSSAMAGSSGDMMMHLLEQNMNVLSYEQTTHMSFEVEYSGGDEEFQDIARRIKNVADAMEITAHTKFVGSAEKEVYESYTAAAMKLDPIAVTASMWMDVNASAGKLDFMVEIPGLIKAFLPEEYAKDYLYIQYDRLMELYEEDMDFYYYNTMNISEYLSAYGMQNKIFELAEPMNLVGHLNDNVDLRVTENADGTVTIGVYMNDAQLKRLVLALLNEIYTNEAAADAAIDIMYELTGVSGYSMYIPEREEMREELLDSLDYFLPVVENYFMRTAILNSRGYSYEAVLNSDGFIEREDVVVGIRISESLMNPYRYSSRYYRNRHDSAVIRPAVLDVTVISGNVYTNINEEISIDIPSPNAENVVNLVEAIAESVEREREERKFYFPYSSFYNSLRHLDENPENFALHGTYGDEDIDTEITLIRSGYDIYMPLAQAAEIFGGEAGWDADAGAAYWLIDDMEIIFATRERRQDDDFYEYYYGVEEEEYADGDYYYDDYYYDDYYYDDYYYDDYYYDDYYYDDYYYDDYWYDYYYDDYWHYDSYFIIRTGVIQNNAMFVRLADIENYTGADFGFDDHTGIILLR